MDSRELMMSMSFHELANIRFEFDSDDILEDEELS